MPRSLVIGGTLFIGRALVEQLLARGDAVVIMHRGTGTPFGSRVGEIQCDRNDIAAVRAALEGEPFDFIYDNVFDWTRGTSAEQVSAAATANVKKGLRRYVFTSSVAAYEPGAGERDEDAALARSDNENGYGVKKAESESALFALWRERGVPVSTIRPAFIYGPNNPFDRESFFWDRLLAGRPILIPDDGRTLQLVLATDVARASVLASERDVAIGRAYNLASYPPIAQADFVRLLAKIARMPANLVQAPRERLLELGGGLSRPPYYFGAYLDLPPITVLPDRAQSELGLALTPLEDGLRETFRWYQRQQRTKPDFSWEDKALAALAPGTA